MSATTEFGSVREVWFAKLTDPTTKWSFLIRDDAYSKAGAAFGRTIRTGDGIDTGPHSGWRQLSWEGGKQQEYWKDNQMFLTGRADPQTRTGKLGMWGGFTALYKNPDRTVNKYIFARASTGSAGNSDLYIAEQNLWGFEAAPNGGYNIFKYNVATGAITSLPKVTTAAGGWRAIAHMEADDQSGDVFAITEWNKFWLYDPTHNTFAQDTGAPTDRPFQSESLIAFGNAMYYLYGNVLAKRVPAPPYGIIGTHTKVKEFKSAQMCKGITVWNNRIYFGVTWNGFRTAVYVSDGVSVAKAFDIPGEFFIDKLHVHYGALYISGIVPNALTTSGGPNACGKVLKFTGSSLTTLWDGGYQTDGKPHYTGGMASYGQNLVVGVTGFPGQETHTTGVGPQPQDRERAGLLFYDAEKDALFEGPGIDYDANNTEGIQVTNVIEWDNTLVIGAHDLHNYGAPLTFPKAVLKYRPWDAVGHTPRHNMSAAPSFSSKSFEAQPATRTDFILSSKYRGDEDVAMQTKTWLYARVRARLSGTEAQLRLAIITNEGASEKAIKTWTWSDFGSQTGWKTFVVALKDTDGSYFQSEQLQYKLYLDNTSASSSSHSYPEVDSVEVLWTVAPVKRRTWRLRAICTDAQARLDGTSNSLTTAATLRDKLEELWSSREPVYFWDAGAVGGTPSDTSNAVEVFMPVEGFNEQAYRVVSDDTTVAREVTLTLYENAVG